MGTTEITPAMVRLAAMNHLSLREHSARELQQKLARKYPEPDLIAEVIQRLANEGLQSDQRFVEAFIAMRKRQGKGPLIIVLELKVRGIGDDLVHDFLQPDSECWKLMAIAARQKKFGLLLPQDAKEKAKQMRFLSARGFSSQHINHALTYDGEDNT